MPGKHGMLALLAAAFLASADANPSRAQGPTSGTSSPTATSDNALRVEGSGPMDIDPDTGKVRAFRKRGADGLAVQIYDKFGNRYRYVTPASERWRVFDQQGNGESFSSFSEAQNYLLKKNSNPSSSFQMQTHKPTPDVSIGNQLGYVPRVGERPSREYVDTDELILKKEIEDLEAKKATALRTMQKKIPTWGTYPWVCPNSTSWEKCTHSHVKQAYLRRKGAVTAAIEDANATMSLRRKSFGSTNASSSNVPQSNLRTRQDIRPRPHSSTQST